MSEAVTITETNFEYEVLGCEVPVLLDFWAPWCGPCKMIIPVINQLAEEYSGRVKIGTINVDDEATLASSHGVVSIPTLVVYENGRMVNQAIGALGKRQIEALFKDLIDD